MSWYEWFPAISTSVLLGVAMSIAGLLLRTRLTKSVQHEFDRKIEDLRNVLRKDEESFRADLKSKESQIEALRNGVLTSKAKRQEMLDERRIEAATQLWSALVALGSAKGFSAAMSVFKFENALRESATNDRFRGSISAMFGDFDKLVPQSNEISKVRPFVSSIAWALFSAYQTIILYDFSRLKMLQSGLDMPELLDHASVSKIVVAALPHQAAYVERVGGGVYYFLLDELESRLLEEVNRMLQGSENDIEAVAQSAKILAEVNSANDLLLRAKSEMIGG
ncbi:hypothetical protein [Humidesulfovibrio sp.]